MDAVLDQIRDAVEAPIDFEGQRLATLVNYAFLSTFGVISFLAGFTTGNIWNALWAGLGGAIITLLAFVPPWPMYNRNPVAWLPARKIAGYWVEQPDAKKTS